MSLRPRLTYANVVATLALVLAIGGGTVYAALRLGKDTVHSKNIATGAVKSRDLGKNAVTSPKVKDGTIKADDLAAGVIPALDADVTGSATGGPRVGLNTNTAFAPLPLTGTTTFTPNAGEVAALAAEAQFTIATTNAAQPCSPAIRLFLNGEPTRIFVDPESGEDSTTVVKAFGRDAAGPYGLLAPGTPLTVTAEARGDVDCTANSQIDRVQVSIVQIK